MRHRRITEMVEVHVLDSMGDGIRKPTVDQAGSSLNGLRFRSRERHEMGAGVSTVIEYRQACHDLSFMNGHVTLHVVRSDGRHRAVILDVVLLVEMLYGGGAERFHEFEVGDLLDFRSGREEFLRRTPGAFVPLLAVVRRIDDGKPRLSKMGTYPHAPPTFGNVGSPGGNPNHEARTEPHALEKSDVRLFFEPLEFRDIEEVSNALQPTETIIHGHRSQSADFEVFSVR